MMRIDNIYLSEKKIYAQKFYPSKIIIYSQKVVDYAKLCCA